MKAEEDKSVFHEWASATTAHGFLDFSQAETKISKIIWFILITVSLVIMGYQVTRNVQDWTLHEWKTSVQEVTGDNCKSMIFHFSFKMLN